MSTNKSVGTHENHILVEVRVVSVVGIGSTVYWRTQARAVGGVCFQNSNFPAIPNFGAKTPMEIKEFYGSSCSKYISQFMIVFITWAGKELVI